MWWLVVSALSAVVAVLSPVVSGPELPGDSPGAMWWLDVSALSAVVAVVFAVVTAEKQWFKIKPIEEVVKDMGYEIERHDITTADGYILTYHRLPRGRNLEEAVKEVPENRKVVLLYTGILMSSAAVLADRRDIPYALADAGFDVWLGNYRGNTLSRRHKFLDPDRDNQFWDFSLDEFGTKDLPASIDYILDKTGASKLIYVGVSMGTTMFWVLGSALPQYMDKVEAMVAVAPVARPSHIFQLGSILRQGATLTASTAAYAVGYREVMSYKETVSSMTYWACTHGLRPMCLFALEAFNLVSGQDWDGDKYIESLKYSPAGISSKVVQHYIQLTKAETFQQFDYGLEGNRQRYNSDSPPQYNLKNVNCTIFLVTSDDDTIAANQDVEWLTEQLPRKPTRILQDTVKNLGHFGWRLDKQALDLVVKPLTAFMKERFLDSAPEAKTVQRSDATKNILID